MPKEVSKTLDINTSLVWKNVELTSVARHPEYGIIPLFTRQGGEFQTRYSPLIVDEEQEGFYIYFEYDSDQECWNVDSKRTVEVKDRKEYDTLDAFYYNNQKDRAFVMAYFDDPNLLIDFDAE